MVGFHSTINIKSHIASDQRSPFLGLTPVNMHDSKMFGSILNRVKGLCGRDMYRKIGTVFAKGYDVTRRPWGRMGLVDGIHVQVKFQNPQCQQGKHHYVVERTYAWFKAFRRIGVRYERRDI